MRIRLSMAFIKKQRVKKAHEDTTALSSRILHFWSYQMWPGLAMMGTT